MFPGINLLLLLCSNTYSWFKKKLVKIGGSSEPLEPPWLRACMCVMLLEVKQFAFTQTFLSLSDLHEYSGAWSLNGSGEI